MFTLRVFEIVLRLSSPNLSSSFDIKQLFKVQFVVSYVMRSKYLNTARCFGKQLECVFLLIVFRFEGIISFMLFYAKPCIRVQILLW